MSHAFRFLRNNLFTSYTLEVDFPQIYDFEGNKDQAKVALDSIKAIYNKEKFISQNEHQFEDDFISEVLEILGWSFIRQEEKIIQGKLEKPDFLLFTNQDSKNTYLQIPKEQRTANNEHFSVIAESKAYKIEIDNKKIKDNPHFQILRYLSNLKKDYGILTNGRLWRFYDNSKLSSTKIFYEVDVEAILQLSSEGAEQLQAFNYFYHIFHAKNFSQDSQNKATIEHSLEKNTESKTLIEEDLRSLIYGINGKDSVFEKIGACLYRAKMSYKSQSSPHSSTTQEKTQNPEKDQKAHLNAIYENTLYFTFRLLFIAYFEDKFDEVLEQHSCFKARMSLQTLLKELQDSKTKEKSFIGIGKLEDIFRIYNEGKPNYDMPIFNGGLFDSTKTPLLSLPKIFNDQELIDILESLFYFKDGLNLYRRDYRTLSIAHLGTIYEGLLSYFFEIASEDIFYLEYTPKRAKKQESKSIEGYFDSYDYAHIANDKALQIHKAQSYKKGEIYLKNTSNSRKSTASFYTPESITKFLCQSALQEALEKRLKDSTLLHFKILDNACGSGHFLIESLNAITKIVLENFESFPSFKALYESQKDSITQNVAQFIPDYKIDESDILKRLLLKRVIYGVDVNPFSVELTKLALWIDSFIFGTPLSFLEHHIKCGNALVGSSIAEFKQNTLESSKQSLFLRDLDSAFNVLQEVFYKLDSLKDNTESDIKESKRLYNEEILPTLKKLNLYLNYENAKHFIKDPQEKQILINLSTEKLEGLGVSQESEMIQAKELIESYAKTYRFFNYEIEFPEIVSDGVFVGFDIIIGNPPWDKTKFSDSDFFPQFISNYRTLSNSKKEEIKTNLLAKPYIKAQYEREKAFIQSVNDYYKESYPLNSGSGDGNLFRFFVEKNLHLLAKNATLNYVLPSALMLEEGSLSLRKKILENKRLNFFYGFENREGIFNDVHRSYKFALMQVQNTQADSTHKIKTMFYKTNIDSVYDTNNIIETSLEEIATLSPSQIALQEVRDKKDLEILAKCYASFKPLSLEWLDFRNELHMTADKDLFIESYSDDLLPLYEGKMIHQFNAEFSEPTYFLDSTSFDERLRSKEIHRLKQDLGLNSKEYEKLLKTMLEGKESKMTREELEDSFIRYDREFFRLGFRGIASDTNERTLIFSLLPKNVGFGHSMFANTPKKYALDSNGGITTQSVSYKRILFALGICNSLVVDYIARGMVQINVSKTYLERIPLPQPSDEELESNQDYRYIYINALILQLYHDKAGDFEDLQKEFGIDKGQIPSTQKAYDTLRAKLDIHIAKLYGLSKEEFCAMLESFKVLHDKQAYYIALLKSLWE